jgi:hypothetical protein
LSLRLFQCTLKKKGVAERRALPAGVRYRFHSRPGLQVAVTTREPVTALRAPNGPIASQIMRETAATPRSAAELALVPGDRSVRPREKRCPSLRLKVDRASSAGSTPADHVAQSSAKSLVSATRCRVARPLQCWPIVG